MSHLGLCSAVHRIGPIAADQHLGRLRCALRMWGCLAATFVHRSTAIARDLASPLRLPCRPVCPPGRPAAAFGSPGGVSRWETIRCARRSPCLPAWQSSKLPVELMVPRPHGHLLSLHHQHPQWLHSSKIRCMRISICRSRVGRQENCQGCGQWTAAAALFSSGCRRSCWKRV